MNFQYFCFLLDFRPSPRVFQMGPARVLDLVWPVHLSISEFQLAERGSERELLTRPFLSDRLLSPLFFPPSFPPPSSPPAFAFSRLDSPHLLLPTNRVTRTASASAATATRATSPPTRTMMPRSMRTTVRRCATEASRSVARAATTRGCVVFPSRVVETW